MPAPPSMFETSRVPAASASTDGYIQPNFGHALRIWWALFWRTNLVAGILDYGLGVLLRMLYEQGTITAGVLTTTAKYGEYVLNYAVALFVMYYVLHKTFRTFRIALTENWSTPQARVLEPTVARSTRIWWTYTWRTILYTVILYVAATLPLSAIIGILSVGPISAALFTSIVGLLISGVAALFAIHSNILDEDFRNFHVAIVPRTISVPGAEMVPNATQN